MRCPARYILVIFLLILSTIFSLALADEMKVCHSYNSDMVVPEGYGAPYDVWSNKKELLIKVTCSSGKYLNKFNITVGNRISPNQNLYIHEKGYLYKNGKWYPFNYSSPDNIASSHWHRGYANFEFPLHRLEDLDYVVAYTCIWIDTKLKCGCRDTICTNSYWQLQKVQISETPLNTESPDCSITSIEIDDDLSNNVINGLISGLPCSATITIQNSKNHWTNFITSTVGSVTITPVGGDLNLYTKFGLLPPSGFLPLLPEKSVTFKVNFSKPGEAVIIFADPTLEFNSAAAWMNILQAMLNVLPLGGASILVIENHQKIVEAFQEMPHLQNAAAAVFRNDLDLVKFIKEFHEFSKSKEESVIFYNLLIELGFNISFEALKTYIDKPWDIINSIVNILGNIRTSSDNPSGSIIFVAE